MNLEEEHTRVFTYPKTGLTQAGHSQRWSPFSRQNNVLEPRWSTGRGQYGEKSRKKGIIKTDRSTQACMKPYWKFCEKGTWMRHARSACIVWTNLNWKYFEKVLVYTYEIRLLQKDRRNPIGCLLKRVGIKNVFFLTNKIFICLNMKLVFYPASVMYARLVKKCIINFFLPIFKIVHSFHWPI